MGDGEIMASESQREKIFGIYGSRVVITGGTGGIGAALVQGFLDAGSQVVVATQSEESAREHGEKFSGESKPIFLTA